jgi:hypothetical protein
MSNLWSATELLEVFDAAPSEARAALKEAA